MTALVSLNDSAERLRRYRTLWRLFRREREDPAPFYTLLGQDAANDLERHHGPLAGQTIVDLGCGPGWYASAMRAHGAEVIPVDRDYSQMTYGGVPPEGFVVADAGDLPLPDASVDGAFCSNMLEHTPRPDLVIGEIARVLRPGGWGCISFTNWYSPHGGHEMNPYQYLGPKYGPQLYERRHGRPPKNVYGSDLFPTHIGPTLKLVRSQPGLRVDRVEPRYWPRLAFLCRIPVVREFVTWNCVIRVTKR